MSQLQDSQPYLRAMKLTSLQPPVTSVTSWPSFPATKLYRPASKNLRRALTCVTVFRSQSHNVAVTRYTCGDAGGSLALSAMTACRMPLISMIAGNSIEWNYAHHLRRIACGIDRCLPSRWQQMHVPLLCSKAGVAISTLQGVLVKHTQRFCAGGAAVRKVVARRNEGIP